MAQLKASLESIQQEIQSQIKDIAVTAIEELNLDTLDIFEISPELKQELEKFTNLLSLTLNECSLTNLENFPKLPNLARLELCDNKLQPSSLLQLKFLTNLQTLALGGNDIKTVDDLLPLKDLESLMELDLLGCDINLLDNYREKVFELLPTLFTLDNYDKNGNDLDLNNDDENDEEEEPYQKNAKQLITKEVIIIDSSEEEEDDRPVEIKEPKNAEEYFRKKVFKEKLNEKYETFEIGGKKKPRSETSKEDDPNTLKKVKL